MRNIKLEVGVTVGQFTILEVLIKGGVLIYVCRCFCGITENKQGHVLLSEKDNKRCVKCKRKHDPLTRTRDSYKAMMARCTNPKHEAYSRYSNLNPPVCERWSEPKGAGFKNFLEDMGERPDGLTIDRIDNTRGYSKDNCRWASYEMQTYNIKKKASNKSGKTGVCWNKVLCKWLAYICKERKLRHLGYFVDLEDAIAARMKAELEVYGFNKP